MTSAGNLHYSFHPQAFVYGAAGLRSGNRSLKQAGVQKLRPVVALPAGTVCILRKGFPPASLPALGLLHTHTHTHTPLEAHSPRFSLARGASHLRARRISKGANILTLGRCIGTAQLTKWSASCCSSDWDASCSCCAYTANSTCVHCFGEST